MKQAPKERMFSPQLSPIQVCRVLGAISAGYITTMADVQAAVAIDPETGEAERTVVLLLSPKDGKNFAYSRLLMAGVTAIDPASQPDFDAIHDRMEESMETLRFLQIEMANFIKSHEADLEAAGSVMGAKDVLGNLSI